MPISIESFGIKELRRALGPDVVDRALASTINKVAAQASTAVSKAIRGKYTIRAKDLRRRGSSNRGGISVRRARVGNAEAIILGRGSALPLIRFRTSPRTPEAERSRKRRKGVRVTVQRGKPFVARRAFVAQMRSGHVGVFQRTGRSRLPVRELFGPSVPQMLGETDSVDAIFRTAEQQSARIFESEIRFRVQRAVARGR